MVRLPLRAEVALAGLPLKTELGLSFRSSVPWLTWVSPLREPMPWRSNVPGPISGASSGQRALALVDRNGEVEPLKNLRAGGEVLHQRALGDL